MRTDETTSLEPSADDGDRSIFTYSGTKSTYDFDRAELKAVVDQHFQCNCILKKLGQGGYHKVYDIFRENSGASLGAVIRVASPVFPGDKMRSEIATMSYIAAHTSLPVPPIYAWNTESSNSVGAEWMIMQKIPGSILFDSWQENLISVDVKLNVVRQVTKHIRELFSLRFAEAGSIYFSSDAYSRSSDNATGSDPAYKIGPVVGSAYFQSIDGELEYPSTDLHIPGSASFNALHAFRGPFTKTGDFLAHELRANMFKYKTFPAETLAEEASNNSNDASEDNTPELDPRAKASHNKDDSSENDLTKLNPRNTKELKKASSDAAIAEKLERAKRAMEKGIELCYIYPGDSLEGDGATPFTIHLDDLRLSNILIDEVTGKVNGYIDFENAITAPLWYAARELEWVPDPMSYQPDAWGGTQADQFRLWKTFHSAMDACDSGAEWRTAYEKGGPFRRWGSQVGWGWNAWANHERQVDRMIAWASNEANKGKGMPNFDEKWGFDYDELERSSVLERYGPDPTESEGLENIK